jgi:ABC-type uncharacterized transport system substrate-binding protein
LRPTGYWRARRSQAAARRFQALSNWKLVINLKAAKELGLEIPAGLIPSADRVIE